MEQVPAGRGRGTMVMGIIGFIALTAITPLSLSGLQGAESDLAIGLYAELAILNLILAVLVARIFSRNEESKKLRSKISELELQIAEERRLRLHVSEFAAGPLLRRIASEASTRMHGRWIQTHIPASPLTVYGDAVAFREIAQALLKDAISATPENSIIIVRAHDAENEIVVSVDDQGAERPEPEFARKLAEAEGLRLWTEVVTGGGRTVSFAIPKPAAPRSPLGKLEIVQESSEPRA